MKPCRSRRVISIFLIWLCVIVSLFRSDAATFDHDETMSGGMTFDSGDDSTCGDETASEALHGLRPASLQDLPDADQLREALLDLFDDAHLDTETVPLYLDHDAQVWVEHNHDFYALLPAFIPNNDDDEDHEATDTLDSDDDVNIRSMVDGDTILLSEDDIQEYIQHQHEAKGEPIVSMSQAVHNIVERLFYRKQDNTIVEDEPKDECEQSCDDGNVDDDDDSALQPDSSLPPTEVEALERKVLVDFFTEAWSNMWTNIDDKSKHTCQFRGVLCEHRVTSNHHLLHRPDEPPVYQVVTRLELTQANLHATLPASLTELRHLAVLNLAGNRLFGSIPMEYSNMSESLYYFDLGENNLTGSIPENFLASSKRMQEIRVNHNLLSGPVIEGSEDWEVLKVLDVSDNFLTGSLPSSLAHIPNLQYLVMGNNFISGTIPDDFQDMPYLYMLDAGSNLLNDTLERVAQLLPLRLIDVNLEDNYIRGTISDEMFDQEQLELLMLSHNVLTGTLPSSDADNASDWSDLPNLRVLHLSDNQLSGTLPPELFTGLKSSLSSLMVGQNRLTGTIPDEIGALSSVYIIDLMGNHLRGTIPTTMLQLNRNLRFNFTDNLLTGTIPGLFCGEGATATSMLYQENGCDAVLCRPGTFNIHGHATLHACCRQCPATENGELQDPPISQVLGRTSCEGLEYVHGDLNGDGVLSPREVLRMLYIDTLGRFWGSNYHHWANMTYNECDLEGVKCVKGRVTKLDLANANMCSDGNRKPGPISYCKGLPAEIGELKSLEVLQLSRRQFLRGSLPTEIGKLTNLKSLDLSSCVFMTGTLPSELSRLTNLKQLKIVHTQMRGTIPSELFSLSSLEILHLTNNKFTGTLPPTRMPNVKELMIARNMLQGVLPTEIGEMKKLENFEAYHNEFTGQLPNEFGACSLLKRIDVFSNQFSGTIPNSLLNADALQILHLKGNMFSGTIPELGKLPRMSWIDLSNNNLHGTVPQSLGTSQVIEDLRLGGNMLYDPIPRGLCSNPNVNGGATKQYGCDGILCPLGTYADSSGHASETYGPCVKCPPGETTLYLGSFQSACQVISPEEILTIFFEVMQGDVWPADAQRHWGDMDVDICEWSGISCDANGELVGLAFPLAGLDDY